MARIERHVKRSFGISESPRSDKSPMLSKGEKKKTKDEPSITPEQALKVFDDLSMSWDRERPQVVETKLQEMTIPDLKLIANELGITFPTNPSKKSLYSGIIGRLNERAMLSMNVNVTPSQRERMKNDETND